MQSKYPVLLMVVFTVISAVAIPACAENTYDANLSQYSEENFSESYAGANRSENPDGSEGTGSFDGSAPNSTGAGESALDSTGTESSTAVESEFEVFCEDPAESGDESGSGDSDDTGGSDDQGKSWWKGGPAWKGSPKWSFSGLSKGPWWRYIPFYSDSSLLAGASSEEGGSEGSGGPGGKGGSGDSGGCGSSDGSEGSAGRGGSGGCGGSDESGGSEGSDEHGSPGEAGDSEGHGNGATATIYAYDEAGNLIGSYVGEATNWGEYSQLTISSDTFGISSVRLSANSRKGKIRYDDLKFRCINSGNEKNIDFDDEELVSGTAIGDYGKLEFSNEAKVYSSEGARSGNNWLRNHPKEGQPIIINFKNTVSEVSIWYTFKQGSNKPAGGSSTHGPGSGGSGEDEGGCEEGDGSDTGGENSGGGGPGGEGSAGHDGSDSGSSESSSPDPLITRPTSGSPVSGVVGIVAEEGEASEIESAIFEYSSDEGSSWTEIGTDTDGSDGWSVSWDSSKVSDGSFFLRVTMQDLEGQEGTDQVAVTVQNVADSDPSFLILYPSNGGTVSGSQTVMVSTDMFLTKVAFQGSDDRKSWVLLAEDFDGMDSWFASIDFDMLPEGTYYLRAVGTMADGSMVNSKKVQVTIQR